VFEKEMNAMKKRIDDYGRMDNEKMHKYI